MGTNRAGVIFLGILTSLFIAEAKAEPVVAKSDWARYCEQSFNVSEAEQREILASAQKAFFTSYSSFHQSFYTDRKVDASSFASVDPGNFGRMERDLVETKRYEGSQIQKLENEMRKEIDRRRSKGLKVNEDVFVTPAKDNSYEATRQAINRSCSGLSWSSSGPGFPWGRTIQEGGVRSAVAAYDLIKSAKRDSKMDRNVVLELETELKEYDRLRAIVMEWSDKVAKATKEQSDANSEYARASEWVSLAQSRNGQDVNYKGRMLRVNRFMEPALLKEIYQAAPVAYRAMLQAHQNHRDVLTSSERKAAGAALEKEEQRLGSLRNLADLTASAWYQIPDHDQLARDRAEYCSHHYRKHDLAQSFEPKLKSLKNNFEAIQDVERLRPVLAACLEGCRAAPERKPDATYLSAYMDLAADISSTISKDPNMAICRKNEYLRQKLADSVLQPEKFAGLNCHAGNWFDGRTNPCETDFDRFMASVSPKPIVGESTPVTTQANAKPTEDH